MSDLKNSRSKVHTKFGNPVEAQKDYAYDLNQRAKKGNPYSLHRAYEKSREMKDLSSLTAEGKVSATLLENTVVEAYGVEGALEAMKNRTKAVSVALTGDATVASDNAAAAGTYTAVINSKESRVPVKFTLATYEAADIVSVTAWGEAKSVAELLDAGIEVLTNNVGDATIVITFAANKLVGEGILTAAIADTHRWVETTDTDTQAIAVDTQADGD